MEFYNAQVAAFQQTKPTGKLKERKQSAKAFARKTSGSSIGREEATDHLANGRSYTVDECRLYRQFLPPVFQAALYFNREMNHSIRQFPEIYPSPEADNLGICPDRPGVQ